VYALVHGTYEIVLTVEAPVGSVQVLSMLLKAAGPGLDREIERKLNGDAKKRTPPYSTSEKAASRLLRRLEMQDMPCTVEQIDGAWYCTLWVVFPSCRERLATGSGETRALAIARAVMNARVGMGASLSSSSSRVSRRVQWAQTGPANRETRTCAECGVSLPPRNREAASRRCTVCSWRASRFSSSSKLRPIPIEPEPEAG
jgi:hypothetical protein